MKASFYLHYSGRSLLRSGQHSFLAILCIAVGVMAIVSLQLVGSMLQHSLADSARDATGGDIAINASGAPLRLTDLSFFDQLKEQGLISSYTAVIGANGSLSNQTAITQTFPVEAVNPASFPLVSPPQFRAPSGATLHSALEGHQVAVTEQFLTLYHKQLNERFPLYVKSLSGAGETLTVTIAGVIANSGSFAQAGNLVLLSQQTYLAARSAALATYTLIDLTTSSQAQTVRAVAAINRRFPLVSVQTASDLFKAQQSSIDQISQFLKIAGLLALLIGGVGIMNTMQVLLSRRRTEIAMLKTVGYRRRDLYLLFGLEAGLLGLGGGLLGALAATGVSYLTHQLLQSLGISLPFLLNYSIIASGLLTGTVTALIFGLLPIAQAASIRPLQVLRESEIQGRHRRGLTLAMLFLLSLLCCSLASVILENNYVLAVGVTYGTFACLLLLSSLFSTLLGLISRLPVPERPHPLLILLALAGLVSALVILPLLPMFSFLLLALALLGLALPWLPPSWKISLKMALRNIGRRRARVTATVLALFIGVYGVGLDIGLGQDLQERVSSVLSQQQPYNLVVTTSGSDSTRLAAHLHSIPGLSASRVNLFSQTLPMAINGRPAQGQMPGGDYGQQDRAILGGLEGFDLTHSQPTLTLIAGRNLSARDANSNNILISAILTRAGWSGLNLRPGDTITFTSLDGQSIRTAHIVGVFSIASSYQTLGKVLAPASFVASLSPQQANRTAVFYLKVPTTGIVTALQAINQIVPNAAAQNLTDGALAFLQVVKQITLVLLALALLSLLAGVLIIANAVALAMLERRRELGILKAVGYTARSLLGQIAIEYAVAGGLGSSIAALLAAGGVILFSKVLFNSNLILSMEPGVMAGLVAMPLLLAASTAALVAWQATRVRPLIVLRYE
jgi:putative ABC transport system permease protein